MPIPVVKIAGAQYPSSSPLKTGDREVELGLHNAVLELEEYWVEHKNDPIPALAEPPQYDYSYCGDCETAKQKEFQSDVDAFVTEVTAQEKAILDRAMSLSRRASSLLSERSHTFIQHRLAAVIDITMRSLQKKVSFLVDQYIDSALYCEAVATLALRTDRQIELLGLETDVNIATAFERSCATLTEMINTAIDANDYGVARNMNLVFSTLRKYQLMGMDMPGYVLEKALTFNKDESYGTR